EYVFSCCFSGIGSPSPLLFAATVGLCCVAFDLGTNPATGFTCAAAAVAAALEAVGVREMPPLVAELCSPLVPPDVVLLVRALLAEGLAWAGAALWFSAGADGCVDCPCVPASAALDSMAFFCCSAFMVLRVFSMTSGFCAHAAPTVIVNARMPVVSFIAFPYLLTGCGVCPDFPPAVLAGGSMSSLKHVVAVHVATTLSLAAYWYVCFVLASLGFRV